MAREPLSEYTELAKEWHPTKNGRLTPNDVTAGMTRKAWWICFKGHEWEATISSRANGGHGCPFCSGRFATFENSLENVMPHLAKEWHPTKNGDLTPNKVKPRSNKKVWWLCEKGHEYDSAICNRASGTNCPYCAGKRIDSTNSLQVLNLSLAKEWHPSKNGPLTPSDVTTGASKKIWWKCKNGHEWEATVNHRNSGGGCPYCSGRNVCIDNCLQTVNPEVASQWHPTKNGKVTPYHVTKASTYNAWWICEKGHEWQVPVSQRGTRKRGCPYCSNKIANKKYGNDLETYNPLVAKRWHPTKNGVLTPDNITPGSSRKVWWLCERGHEFKMAINKCRVNSCPKCNNQTSFAEQAIFYYMSLIFPETKNRFQLFEMEADVYIKELNIAIEYDGYPYHAKPINIKRDERKNKIFHDNNVCLIRIRAKDNPKVKNFGCIIYNHDEDKNYFGSLKKCIISIIKYIKKNYNVPNIDEIENKIKSIDIKNDNVKIQETYVFKSKEQSILSIPKLINEWHPTKNGNLNPESFTKGSSQKLWWKCEKGHEWVDSLNGRHKGGIIRDCPYCSGKRACPENCLAAVHPKIAQEWYSSKNGKLTPYDVLPSASNKVWWACEKGHEWQATINSRNKSGCPYCGGKKACIDNCLQTTNPEIASQWHPTKNGDKTPFDVTKGSKYKAWWKCEKEHEWQASISDRNNGRGCPYCSGKKVCNDNCLATISPVIASQWHPAKNGKLTPSDVTYSSGKKVWWLCPKGHEFQACINSKTEKSCKYCSRKAATKETSLLIEKPEIAKLWHPSRNGRITPSDITRGSGKVFWWRCSKGHEWESNVANVVKFGTCPYCTRKRINYGNSLAYTNPDIAKQWHPDKNKSLTPKDVMSGSGTSVWWKCEQGHEWQTSIYSRKKSGCPYCSGKRLHNDNSLYILNPLISKEWDYTKNGDITPKDVTLRSSFRAWWICPKGHSYDATVLNKTAKKPTGCPYCSNKKIILENSLFSTHPSIAKQWHSNKNGNLTAKEVSAGSNKKVWWKCEKGHEWEAIINDRKRGRGCPYCSGRRKL